MMNDNSKKEVADSISDDDLAKVKVSKKKKSFISKKISEINQNYEDMNKDVFNLFSPRHYDFPPQPPAENITIVKDEDDEVVSVTIKPDMIRPWIFQYYNTPTYQAQLAVSMLMLLIMIFIMVASTFYPSIPNMVGIVILILLGIALLSNSMIYFGLGIHKIPVRELPLMSSFISLIPVEGFGYLNEEEGQEEENTAVEPVEDYHNGVPSPATILTQWMNNPEILWNEEELVERSGGLLTTRTVRRLLEDNSSEWLDEDNLRVLSTVTGTNSQQWISAHDAWVAERQC